VGLRFRQSRPLLNPDKKIDKTSYCAIGITLPVGFILPISVISTAVEKSVPQNNSFV
jgi:hypothetical protein